MASMFLLSFTFLINPYVAGLKSSVGCAAMAAVMHYFLLTTFTWFAVQAFHFCLQLHSKGKIVIGHYMLKVCIPGWGKYVVIVFPPWLYHVGDICKLAAFLLYFQLFLVWSGLSCLPQESMVKKSSTPVTLRKM